MPTVSVRNVPEDVANWLREKAGAAGKSREQWLRELFANMKASHEQVELHKAQQRGGENVKR